MQINSTFFSIDLNALMHNYHFFQSRLAKNTKIIAVIKAFAYGHDDVAIAKRLEKENISYFAVAYIKEGIRLRKAGITTPILVSHPQSSEIEDCIEYQLEPTIYSFTVLETYYTYLQNKKIQNYFIHLKFNTGLNRLGFALENITEVLNRITRDKTLRLASVFSHLSASEDPKERAFTLKQIQTYKDIVIAVQKRLDYTFIRHLANSSGALNYPEANFDMVRIGIGLYGYANDAKWTKQLKNVGSLHTLVSQKHCIKKGESVGYNRAFIAEKETISATLPIGYGDGIPRSWSKGIGFATVNGQKAPIIGNVCMDMIMIDVTNIPCKEGDEVLLLDTKENVQEIADRIGTISYELLTAVSQRLPRRIVGNE